MKHLRWRREPWYITVSRPTVAHGLASHCPPEGMPVQQLSGRNTIVLLSTSLIPPCRYYGRPIFNPTIITETTAE